MILEFQYHSTNWLSVNSNGYYCNFLRLLQNYGNLNLQQLPADFRLLSESKTSWRDTDWTLFVFSLQFQNIPMSLLIIDYYFSHSMLCTQMNYCMY